MKSSNAPVRAAPFYRELARHDGPILCKPSAGVGFRAARVLAKGRACSQISNTSPLREERARSLSRGKGARESARHSHPPRGTETNLGRGTEKNRVPGFSG